jgi:sigma-B regulation protein RsbU (phosphoserine phosphatase)
MYALLYAVDPQLTASDVLRVFHRDEPYLFLGAAFTTTAILAAAFSLVRRKLDPLLIYFALFAFLYGQRLWIQSGLLALLIPPHSEVFLRLRDAMEFVVPIPAFLFFNAAGLLHRGGKLVGYLLGAILGSLALVTLVFGPSRIYHVINNVVVIAVLILLVVQHVLVMLADRTGSPASSSVSRDFAIIRRGFFVFAALAMCDNFALFFGLHSKVEPYGFVVFLGALGYVAARQTLERDQQLGEIQKELEVAKRIQLSILPGGFPSSLNFRVAARYVPMTSVAGDFYDFLVASDTQAGLLIADVSGHGVPAALIASMVKLAATSQRANATHPASLLSGMNSALCGNTQSQFVTAAYVHLDAEAQELRYSAAGHPPMLVLRNGKAFEIEENGLMLAAFDFATYTNAAQPLQRGDRLLLYTDGIVEAANAAGDFFGADALKVVLQKTFKLSPSETADSIIATIRQWSATQDDDWTVLVCDYAADSPSA